MKKDFKMLPNLSDFRRHKEEKGIYIAPIRFETDPITGFFLKCPNCNSILTYQFSEISEEKIKCSGNNCDFVVEVDEIKVKLNS